MRAGILSAVPWGVGNVREKLVAKDTPIAAPEKAQTADREWEEFERGQVRGLVQQLFFHGTQRVRHVVFSAIDAATNIHPLCRQVAEMVAAETVGDVAFIDENWAPAATLSISPEFPEKEQRTRIGNLRASAMPLSNNLFWLHTRVREGLSPSEKPLHRNFEELGSQFEFAIVAAPPAGVSKEAFAMAHAADGIVLVISAARTRRATALKVKNDLDGVRLLGTVLCDREFPIPGGIYRRL